MSKKSMFKRIAECGANVWEMRIQAGTSVMRKEISRLMWEREITVTLTKQTQKEILKIFWILIREGGVVHLNKHGMQDKM